MSVANVAIVGAGQVAAVAARTLRRRGFDGTITLFGDEPHVPYQRPPLSKEFLHGDGDLTDLALLPAKWLANNDIDIRTAHPVTHVDAGARRIRTADGAGVTADAIVFATGGRPRMLPGLPTSDRIHYLRTVDDADRLRGRLAGSTRVGVIGGGFIGLEIAATLSSMGKSVTVVERTALPLSDRLGPAMAVFCAELHRAGGVELRCGVDVTGVDANASGLRLSLSDGSVLEVEEVVVGIGILPNDDVAAAAGLTVADGIVVDSVGRTSVPGIYAAGDVARRYSESAGRHVRTEHFDNANRQAAVVAKAILGVEVVEDGPHWFWSDQFGLNLQLAGDPVGADQTVTRGVVDEREFSVFYLRDGRLVAAFAVDRGEDIMAARQLIGSPVPAPALRDEDVDLWELGEERVS